jgi:hypothetical protein
MPWQLDGWRNPGDLATEICLLASAPLCEEIFSTQSATDYQNAELVASPRGAK